MRAVLALFHLKNITLTQKTVTRDRDEHYIVIKNQFMRKNIADINTYTTNIRAPKYTKQILPNLKRKNRQHHINRDFNIPLSIMHTVSRQKLNVSNHKYEQHYGLNWTYSEHSIQ